MSLIHLPEIVKQLKCIFYGKDHKMGADKIDCYNRIIRERLEDREGSVMNEHQM